MDEEKSKNITSQSALEKQKFPDQSAEPQGKLLLYNKPSELLSGTPGENLRSGRKSGKSKESKHKKPSEIPKLKSIALMSSKRNSKIGATASATGTSKLPVKTEKETNPKKEEGLKCNSDPIKIIIKSGKVKKDGKGDDKIKEAMKDDFSKLVPLYERELKKITDVWVNTIYCSLTMRTNLVKLLFQAFPYIDRSQFYTEDERLLYCISHAKSYTKSEADNLIHFIRTLIANREKAKEDYAIIATNREIAQTYNYDWRDLTRKIAELGEETKQLQMEVPELQKKKETIEANGNEKIRKIEFSICKKDEEIKKLTDQLNFLKQRENSYKGNVFLKVQDYKDIKADVLSLITVQKEFEELKAKFIYQNDMYEKKIKDLEVLLEERKKTLQKEKEVKKQLQTFLCQLQAQQKRLTTTIGKEQLSYVMGRSNLSKDKRREQLWVAAIKLVLKGFLIQTKKLEKDRNKMLLELQSNDSDNLNALANAIIQKDNFIKSIKHQMSAYHKASKCPKTRNSDNSCGEN